MKVQFGSSVTVFVLASVLASCVSAPSSQVASAPSSAPAKPVTKAASAYPVSVKTFNPNGTPAGAVTSSYSPQGMLVRQQVFSSKGALMSTKTGSPREGGWRVVETSASGAVLAIEDFAVGTKGELIALIRRDASERPLAAVEYRYDAGRIVEVATRTGGGLLKTRTVYVYDARGNNTRIEIYDGSGALNTTYERQFESGRVVLEKGSDASGSVVELTKTTWKGGRKLIQETLSPLARTVEYSYEGVDAPSAVVRSVRGQVVERQTFEYQWLTR